jgi:MFS family permease
MQSFKDHFNSGYRDANGDVTMSPREVSLIVALLSAGTVIGALVSAPVGDKWGRRRSLIGAVGVFCIGAIFQVCATNVALLTVGRFVEDPFGGAPTEMIPALT